MNAPPLRRTEGWVASPEGLLLFRRAWLPELPQRVLVLVHGFAEHSGRYEELASWFAARGCAVLAVDLRGHGRSQGRRTHVDAFAQYLDDVDLLMAAAREEHGGLPLLLLGHSMGGLIALSYLQDRQPTIAGAVISAPALSVPSGPRATLARLVRRVLPKLSIAAGLDLAGLSRDPEVVRRYESDPLVERRLTVSLATELFGAAPRAAARGAENPCADAVPARTGRSALRAREHARARQRRDARRHPAARVPDPPPRGLQRARARAGVRGRVALDAGARPMSRRLTHLDARGRARMVDVGAKPETLRVCTARAEVLMSPATLAAIAKGENPKGDVLATARIAGIQAAKRTSDWIPLAHPLPLDAVEVTLSPDPAESRVRVEATVRAHGRTGVEMEALVAVSAASLTIYDMCKAVDRGMSVGSVRLIRKTGGKSGTWLRPGEPDRPT